MKISEVRKKAKCFGIDCKITRSKRELIRDIQKAEGNPQCFDTGRAECPEKECCWREDCIPRG
ncbi:MAG TPA: SAP domain-containing protein [Candidatus Brocadiia bacterium]|nr:SAP domain-containing protein [Candidatus Brocadiia bacterium]